MVAFFDTSNFLCAKILGNIRRNRIADGDKKVLAVIGAAAFVGAILSVILIARTPMPL
jgi:hypothetical protein